MKKVKIILSSLMLMSFFSVTLLTSCGGKKEEATETTDTTEAADPAAGAEQPEGGEHPEGSEHPTKDSAPH